MGSVFIAADHSEVKPGPPIVDHFIIAALFLASTYSFVYGNAGIRLLALALSLVCGLFKPFILVFSLSLASSLDIVAGSVFTPMRIVIVFASASILIRMKYLLMHISRHDIGCIMFYWVFALWCIVCKFIRSDIEEISTVFTTFAFATICFCLFIVVDSKYRIPIYVWLGLAPTVVASLLATLHLRVVKASEYLITGEGLRYRGIVNDPNYLSSILLVGFTTCLICLRTVKGKATKILYSAASIAFFFAIWSSQSRAGIYTAYLSVAMFILLQSVGSARNSKFSNFLLMLVIAVACVAVIFMNPQSRIATYVHKEGFTVVRSLSVEALSPLFRNPVFGPGEASFVKVYGQAPHNTLISFGLEYGIIGMVFMVIVVAYSFFNLWRNREKGALVYSFPLLTLIIVLSSFSGVGHKLLWFYLVAAAIFHERALYDDKTNLAPLSE